jgi:hypothetical protein
MKRKLHMLQFISTTHDAIVHRQPAFPPVRPVRFRERFRRLGRELKLTPPALCDSLVEFPNAFDMPGGETGNGYSRKLLLAARTEAVGGVLILADWCRLPQNADKLHQARKACRPFPRQLRGERSLTVDYA